MWVLLACFMVCLFCFVRPGPISRVVTRVYCVTGRCSSRRESRVLRLRAVVGHVSIRPCALASCPSECSVWLLCPSRFDSARVLWRLEILRTHFTLVLSHNATPVFGNCGHSLFKACLADQLPAAFQPPPLSSPRTIPWQHAVGIAKNVPRPRRNASHRRRP